MKNTFVQPSVALVLLALSTVCSGPTNACAQGTAFTYQGQLESGGAPANGSYDLTFALFSNDSGPSQLGGTLTNTTIVSDGLFTATLDFGPQFPGADRWLEIGVRPSGGGGFSTLAPRQHLTPEPYAITAENLAGVADYNTIAGSYSALGGGYDNSTANEYATVAGGYLNTASSWGSAVGGGAENTASSPDGSATVSGGYQNTASGDSSAVGGGADNAATNTYATVAGGIFNTAGGYGSTVSGGYQNTASGDDSTVGGGQYNVASGSGAEVGGGDGNIASGGNTAISSGYFNTASGNAATVPGGSGNVASGAASFAAGHEAMALNDGSFVWSDYSGGSFSSTAANQFAVSAAGGVVLAGDVAMVGGAKPYHNLSLSGGNSTGFLYGSFPALADGIHLGYNWYADSAGTGHVLNTGGATSRISAGYGQIVLAVGDVNTAPNSVRVDVTTGGVSVYGTFNNNSDRNAKQDFAPVSPAQILDKVAHLPLSEWSYKVDAATRHIGPVAQDFSAAFNIGTDDKHIAPIDEGGVALAAIQGLNEKLQETQQALKTKNGEILELQQHLEALEKMFRNQPSK
ncbi:MAG: tail fiber domain-containing protein [Verrucomicrobiota bacterium]|jgi:hypothetical protein